MNHRKPLNIRSRRFGRNSEVGTRKGSEREAVCCVLSLKIESVMEWTNEQVGRLISEYQRTPVLWDPKLSKRGFISAGAKYEAWHKMAENFQCEITDLKKKMISVFASYRRERSKIRHGNPSFWYLYDRLSFLPNHVANLPGTDAPTKRKRRGSSSEESDDDHEMEPEVDVKPEPITEFYDEPTKIHTKRKLTRGKTKSPPRLAEVSLPTEVIQEPEVRRQPDVRREYEVRREPEVRRDGKDECDSFGEYIAMSLRKHDERTRATMKQAINNIIFELEMKKYTSEPYLVVSDVNPLSS